MPRTLPSNSPLLSIAIAIVFAIGAVLFGLGSVTRRKQAGAEQRRSPVKWPLLVDDSLTDVDVDQRIEMIGRLAVVRTAWARNVLQQAQREETDARAKEAVEAALNAVPSA